MITLIIITLSMTILTIIRCLTASQKKAQSAAQGESNKTTTLLRWN